MGMDGILCSLSPRRQALLVADPDLLDEVLDARKETSVPGLLDLGEAWDALDLMLSNRGEDPVLGDAVLARTGRALGGGGSYRKARVLPPERVRVVHAALAELSPEYVRAHHPMVERRRVQGGYGQAAGDAREREIVALTEVFEALRALYARAAEKGEAVLGVVA